MNRRRVLIETSWNVKIEATAGHKYLFSINRNIVECKVNNGEYNETTFNSINRNIVECKGRYTLKEPVTQ